MERKLTECVTPVKSTHFHRGTTYLHKSTALHRFHTQSQLIDVTEEKAVAPSTFFLWLFFGMGGWWCANAILAELPLFVTSLPEGDKLGNQLSMMLQVGNFFSITYKVIEHRSKHVNVAVLIQCMTCIAFVILLLASFFWDVGLFGSSLPLFMFTALAGGIGCLSDVTYWAFVMAQPPRCTKAMSVGMSLGGLATVGLTALQLNGRPADCPRFGAKGFFSIAALVQIALVVVVFAVQGKLLRAMAKIASPFSTRLKERLALWETYYQDKAGALSRANGAASSPDSMESELHPGPNADGLPQAPIIALFEGANFLIYALTYSMPTLLPFVSSAYPSMTERQQLLLKMMVAQNFGDVLGRMLAPNANSGKVRRSIAMTGIGLLPLVFGIFAVGAVHPQKLASVMDFSRATWLLPILTFLFYFSRGNLTTTLFILARDLTTSQEAAEHIASTMGFLGQMGALTANFVAFAIVNFLKPGA